MNKVSSWEALGKSVTRIQQIMYNSFIISAKMLLRQNNKQQIKLFKAAGKYQVGASLSASRCNQANQNAFSYFGFISNTTWIGRVLFRHFKGFIIWFLTYYGIRNTTFATEITSHFRNLTFLLQLYEMTSSG